MSESSPLVAMLMGSRSDWDTMRAGHEALEALGVPHVCRVLSAHRTPEQTAAFVRESEAAGVEVFICGAGLAAHLAGAVAAHTVRPVLGVPIAGGPLQGLDALLATVQMPGGIPVATLAIGRAGAKNAALLATSILGGTRPELLEKLRAQRAAKAESILAETLP